MLLNISNTWIKCHFWRDHFVFRKEYFCTQSRNNSFEKKSLQNWRKIAFFKRQLFLRLWHKNILYWQFTLAIKKTLLYRFDRLHDWFAYNQIDFSFVFYKNKSLFLKNYLQIIYLCKSNNQKYFCFTLWHYEYNIPFLFLHFYSYSLVTSHLTIYEYTLRLK